VFTSSGFIKVILLDEQERLLFLAARQGYRARMSGSKPLIHLQGIPLLKDARLKAEKLLFFLILAQASGLGSEEKHGS
jgi:hypothetical protein